jgi:hypothetical protein
VSNLQSLEEGTMIWLAAVLPAAAQSNVVFDLNDQQAQDLGIDAQAVADELGQEIGDQLNLVDNASYLQAFADADAIAMKGMGVDYASNPKKFSIGAAFGSGVANVPLTFVRSPTTLPEGGYAFMASIYGGVNLGILTPSDDALDRFTLYVNGLAFDPPGSKSFKGSMKNWGVHAQIKLVGPVNAKVLEWGGLDLTAGYEHSFYALTLSQALPLTQKVAQADLTWTATGTYTISSTAGTVPLELSTNLRVLAITAYGGVGVDVDTAHADSQASLSGPIDAKVGGQSENLGTASVSLTDTAQAEPFSPRLFVGAQVNVLAVKVFGQLNLGLDDAYGGFLGARLAL